MLADDQARCAGFIGDDDHTRCDRRMQCARFTERAGPRTPFHLSVCGDGVDRFIHADTVAEGEAAAHPAHLSSIGVLAESTSTHDRG